jgi:hypothetical protein
MFIAQPSVLLSLVNRAAGAHVGHSWRRYVDGQDGSRPPNPPDRAAAVQSHAAPLGLVGDLVPILMPGRRLRIPLSVVELLLQFALLRGGLRRIPRSGRRRLLLFHVDEVSRWAIDKTPSARQRFADRLPGLVAVLSGFTRNLLSRPRRDDNH